MTEHCGTDGSQTLRWREMDSNSWSRRYLGVATPTSTSIGVTRLAGPDIADRAHRNLSRHAVISLRSRTFIIAT